MCGKEPDRKPSSRSVAAFVAVVMILPGVPVARAADAGVWNSVLETLDVKATPAEPAPDFVRRSRPDPEGLGFMQPAVPHKVSPLAVKTPAQIEAAKNALDAAQTRQLQPTAPPPVQLPKGQKNAKAKVPPVVTD